MNLEINIADNNPTPKVGHIFMLNINKQGVSKPHSSCFAETSTK